VAREEVLFYFIPLLLKEKAAGVEGCSISEIRNILHSQVLQF